MDWRWKSFYFHPPQSYEGVLYGNELRGIMHGGGRSPCPSPMTLSHDIFSASLIHMCQLCV